MGYNVLVLSAYGLSCLLVGVTIASIYWRERFAESSGDIGRLIYALEKQTKATSHWRSEANIHAAELQRLRGLVPQRDPNTHRFVKRANG